MIDSYYMSKTKSIKSQDGKIEVKYDDVTHVCIDLTFRCAFLCC